MDTYLYTKRQFQSQCYYQSCQRIARQQFVSWILLTAEYQVFHSTAHPSTARSHHLRGSCSVWWPQQARQDDSGSSNAALFLLGISLDNSLKKILLRFSLISQFSHLQRCLYAILKIIIVYFTLRLFLWLIYFYVGECLVWRLGLECIHYYAIKLSCVVLINVP